MGTVVQLKKPRSRNLIPRLLTEDHQFALYVIWTHCGDDVTNQVREIFEYNDDDPPDGDALLRTLQPFHRDAVRDALNMYSLKLEPSVTGV